MMAIFPEMEGIVLGHKVSSKGIEAFAHLNKKLSSASIISALDWVLPFELMCDASDYTKELCLDKGRTRFSMLSTMQVVP
ncbi:hypothetical protein I3842_13G115900 [Carya illinoinensis]|uniref:Reverse transcriptase/retrotransposon-derived protein RNase H-like domain-containing protein n=1 Tax=Carya illinoinensis TaxID=32201 RepID=A0A922AII3_CARIL|nr:hypothetical protein I3842_13G115900 [Carya illinoinensis]